MTVRENTANERWAFVLAAGLGSRLKALTTNRPKALVEIAGKSLIAHLLEKLALSGYTHVVVNVHHHATQLKDHLASHDYGLNILISDESSQLMDTGGAILQALPLFPENASVLIHNVDILHNSDLNHLAMQFEQSDALAALVVRNRPSSRKLIFDEKIQLSGWEDQNKGLRKNVFTTSAFHETQYAFSGIHFIRPILFKELEIKPYSVIDLYLMLAAHQPIIGLPENAGWWFDLGKAEEIGQIEAFIRQQKQ